MTDPQGKRARSGLFSPEDQAALQAALAAETEKVIRSAMIQPGDMEKVALVWRAESPENLMDDIRSAMRRINEIETYVPSPPLLVHPVAADLYRKNQEILPRPDRGLFTISLTDSGDALKRRMEPFGGFQLHSDDNDPRLRGTDGRVMRGLDHYEVEVDLRTRTLTGRTETIECILRVIPRKKIQI